MKEEEMGAMSDCQENVVEEVNYFIKEGQLVKG